MPSVLVTLFIVSIFTFNLFIRDCNITNYIYKYNCKFYTKVNIILENEDKIKDTIGITLNYLLPTTKYE